MKVIDLLNKIANGKKLPKEILYDNWRWHLQLGTYMNHIVGKSLFGGYLIGHELLEKLNDEIKIVENTNGKIIKNEIENMEYEVE